VAVKISVEFPSVAFREGPAKVVELAQAIETIGYDDLAVFDHVVMGYATDTRPAPMYPSQMPILEALVTLGFVAAVTERVTLSTEVLVLPQRQAVLVAKQVSSLDTLSGGRIRLGVGVGWQEVEYQSLGEDFSRRGALMDEAMGLLRACWGDARIDAHGERFDADAIAMEPKPPQGASLPVWVGGTGPAARRRAGTLGDGWMGMVTKDTEATRSTIEEVRHHAAAAGRDPDSIGFQAMLAPPPNDRGGKAFYQDHDRVVRRAEEIRGYGFGWLAINATAIFQSGARSVDAMSGELDALHTRLREVVG
jgi:probable F420-dependent oxidoreductase